MSRPFLKEELIGDGDATTYFVYTAIENRQK
jgi:hypothetical protein